MFCRQNGFFPNSLADFAAAIPPTSHRRGPPKPEGLFSENPSGSTARSRVARWPVKPQAPPRCVLAAETQRRCGVAMTGEPSPGMGPAGRVRRRQSGHRSPAPAGLGVHLPKGLPKRRREIHAEEGQPCAGPARPCAGCVTAVLPPVPGLGNAAPAGFWASGKGWESR